MPDLSIAVTIPSWLVWTVLLWPAIGLGLFIPHTVLRSYAYQDATGWGRLRPVNDWSRLPPLLVMDALAWPAVSAALLCALLAERLGVWAEWRTTSDDTGNVVDWNSRRQLHGVRGLRWGRYVTTSWGSRWVTFGPVTVGLKRARWALDVDPPAGDWTT